MNTDESKEIIVCKRCGSTDWNHPMTWPPNHEAMIKKYGTRVEMCNGCGLVKYRKIDIERALAIQGWMTKVELEYLAIVACKSRSIVEIGSWVGRSTCAIAANTYGIVFAVDTWKGGEEQGEEFQDKDDRWIFSEFSKNTDGLNNIRTIKTLSTKAAAYFASIGYQFDLVFIDAKHDYQSVKEDILAWRPLLRKEGILCGHDHHPNWPGVIQAVDELIPKFRVVGTIWTTEGA